MSQTKNLRDVIIDEVIRVLSIRLTPQETKRELATETASRILCQMGVGR